MFGHVFFCGCKNFVKRNSNWANVFSVYLLKKAAATAAAATAAAVWQYYILSFILIDVVDIPLYAYRIIIMWWSQNTPEP